MKFTLKLPDGSTLEFEKRPMSESDRDSLWMAILFLSVIGSILLMMWMFR